jgi:hypothetical protein
LLRSVHQRVTTNINHFLQFYILNNHHFLHQLVFGNQLFQCWHFLLTLLSQTNSFHASIAKLGVMYDIHTGM